jgi:hypothetical protein
VCLLGRVGDAPQLRPRWPFEVSGPRTDRAHANRRSGWQLVPSKPLDDHADETLGCFSRDWPSVAHRSEGEVEVRVGEPSNAVSDLRLATWKR